MDTRLVVARRAALLFALLVCTSASAFSSYTFGYSTPEGHRIWVLKTVLDGERRVIGGNLSCCWQEAGPTTSVYSYEMPRTIDIQWREEDTGARYAAHLELPPELTRRAERLPPFKWLSDNSSGQGRYLIVGIEPGGRVVAWLSNSAYDRNVGGRVLEAVATARAVRRER